jgi:hypothetical protein
MKKEPKFYAKKRTRSGVYITVAEGGTRKELIEKLKEDSETYREKEKKDGKEVY